MRRFVALGLIVMMAAACVTVQQPPADDFSGTRTYRVDGLRVTVPRTFKRFEENGATQFRPDPPVRPSPAILITKEATRDAVAVLDKAYDKIAREMGGTPLAIQHTVAGVSCYGLQAELNTHLLWLYAIPGPDGLWLLQILAPVEWTDEQVLKFHDEIVAGVHLDD